MNMVRFTKFTLASVLVVSLLESVKGRQDQHRKMYAYVLKSGV